MLDEIFDAVAPIFIYHKADLSYKREARTGLKWLKNNRDKVKEFFTDDDLQPSVDNVSPIPFWKAYDELFVNIVGQETDAKPQVDFWGCKGYRLTDSSFFGNGSGYFPLYLDAAALRQRIREG